MSAASRIRIQSSNMYYPYGSLQPGRYSQTAVTSRYGFQGQEKDNEIRGEGNSINYKYRMHDARIGRFFALDPLSPDYPHNSPYAFSENVVINAVELEGLEKKFVYNTYDESSRLISTRTTFFIIDNQQVEANLINNTDNMNTHIVHDRRREGGVISIEYKNTDLSLENQQGKKTSEQVIYSGAQGSSKQYNENEFGRYGIPATRINFLEEIEYPEDNLEPANGFLSIRFLESAPYINPDYNISEDFGDSSSDIVIKYNPNSVSESDIRKTLKLHGVDGSKRNLIFRKEEPEEEGVSETPGFSFETKK